MNHISKSYGDIKAVKDVSFHVKKGSAFAFLGTNGAGKSTVIQMIIHLSKPDKGTITFTDGVLQEVTGVVFQTHRLDEAFTIEENLMVRARLYGMNKAEAKKRVEQFLTLTRLTNKRHRKYGICSGGEKRKTDIIRALLHHPSFLILDEPTTGLDAESREEIWVILRRLQEKHGITIFLTTHYIEEAENMDYVVIMHEGEIVVEGTPDELKSNYSKTTLNLHPKNKDGLIDTLKALHYPFQSESNFVTIKLDKSTDAIGILHHVEANIIDFSLEKASLEKVFLQVSQCHNSESSISNYSV